MPNFRRDFHRGRYENPFQKNRLHVGKPPSKMRRFTGAILLTVVMTTWGVMIFRHPYFDIREVKITGLERIDEASVADVVQTYLNVNTWHLWRHRNFFVANERGITNAIKKKFQLESIDAAFKFPHEITISFKETPRVFLSATINGDVFFASGSGELIEPLSINNDLRNTLSTASLTPAEAPTSTLVSALIMLHAEHPEIPLIVVGRTTPSTLGENLFNSSASANILKFLQNAKTFGLEINYIIVPVETLPEADFYTNEGWGIYLNLTDDPEPAAERLNTLLKTKLKIRKGLRYVDLRFGNRVYYQ